MEEIIEQQLLIRGWAFAAFSTIEKALAGRMKRFRPPYVVQASYKARSNVQIVKEWRVDRLEVMNREV